MQKSERTIQLIALDMDGTLLDANHQISPYTESVIQRVREKGVKVVLVTGRPYIGTVNYTKQLNMMSDDDFVIVCNGALAINPKTERVIAEDALSIEDYYYLESLARSLDVHFHVFDKDNVYTANRDIGKYTVLESFLTGIPLKFRTREEMPADMRFPKMMMIDDPVILDAAIAKLPAELYKRYNVIKSSPYFLEIISKNVNKGLTLKSLTEKLGIPRESVMAMGDQANDLSMLEFAGLGVAMGNAIDDLKAIADDVTDSHDQDGVAKAIEKWCL